MMNQQSLFVTATDTDAGKTFVSCMMLQGLHSAGICAVGVKPIAAGTNDNHKNGDALLLQGSSGIALPYELHNPVCFDEPVAPHLAAVRHHQPIEEPVLTSALKEWQKLPAKWLLIEGAGGWLLPISKQRYLADWVAEQQLPVLLVVGIKLGCLNHAMLTVREIKRSGCQLVGWVANCVDPDMALLQENIADLQLRIPVPCWGVIPNAPSDEEYRQLAEELAAGWQAYTAEASR